MRSARRDQPHGGGRDDEHDGDEQRADRVERDDHGDRDARRAAARSARDGARRARARRRGRSRVASHARRSARVGAERAPTAAAAVSHRSRVAERRSACRTAAGRRPRRTRRRRRRARRRSPARRRAAARSRRPASSRARAREALAARRRSRARAPSAVSCGATPHGPATTSPGNVAVPTACVKKASRRSTIQVPSTPRARPAAAISTSARCMYGAAKVEHRARAASTAPPREARRRARACWPRSSRCRSRRPSPSGRASPPTARAPTRAPASRAIASSTFGLTELSAKIACTPLAPDRVDELARRRPPTAAPRSTATGSRCRSRAMP